MHVTCLRVCSGQLYEVDGIYEKALGAKQAGATEIICPKKNEEQLKVREWVLCCSPCPKSGYRPVHQWRRSDDGFVSDAGVACRGGGQGKPAIEGLTVHGVSDLLDVLQCGLDHGLTIDRECGGRTASHVHAQHFLIHPAAVSSTLQGHWRTSVAWMTATSWGAPTP